MSIRDKILEVANSWVGTPFHHRAMVKDVGVDCGHFIIGVYEEAGVYAGNRPGLYVHDWHLHRGQEMFIGYLKGFGYEQVEDALPGDVAMFQYGRCVSHGAIVVQWPKVIHSYVRLGVVYGKATEPPLSGRFHSFWRHKEVD